MAATTAGSVSGVDAVAIDLFSGFRERLSDHERSDRFRRVGTIHP
jgi:hypothetical protein